jgi:hypothetical protein
LLPLFFELVHPLREYEFKGAQLELQALLKELRVRFLSRIVFEVMLYIEMMTSPNSFKPV